MATLYPINDTLLALVRLGPVMTSSIGATFSYSFHVFFGGFNTKEMPTTAKWAAMPAWFRSVRANGLRVIFAAYNSSIVLGLANTYLYWHGAGSSGAEPNPQAHYYASRAYLAGTLFSVAYYLFTFYFRLIPMNLQLADEKEPVAKREVAEKRLASYDVVRVLVTGGPAALSFLAAATFWAAGR